MLAITLLSTLVFATGAFAQPEQRAMQIERTLMSPFCPGKTLHGCPSPRAAQWRADIRQWVKEGVSGKEIHDRLQARAPGFDLSSRPSGSADWAIPLGAAALATFVLLAVARRWRTREDEPFVETTDEYDRRLDEELARLES